MIIFFIMSQCQAENNTPVENSMNMSMFYDFLFNDSTKVSHDTDIVYNTYEWNPDKTWKRGNSLDYWVDIVGYEGLIKHNNISYINKPPSESAFTEYGITPRLRSKYTVDSLTAHITGYEYDGTNLTVTINSTIRYHCNNSYIKRTEFKKTDYNTPQQYPKFEAPGITAIVYNDSIHPKTVVFLPRVNYTLGYRLEHSNESVEYYHNILKIEYLDNNFPYGNVTKAESNSIYEDSDVFSRLGNNIIINSTEINNSLGLYIITPYHEYVINYSVVNQSDGLKIEDAHVIKLFNILALVFFSVFLIRRFKIRY